MWPIAGDFNEICNKYEKMGGLNNNIFLNKDLNNMSNACCLVDLDAIGPTFTWSNGRIGPNLIRKRLDKAFCCIKWREISPDVVVQNLRIPNLIIIIFLFMWKESQG